MHKCITKFGVCGNLPSVSERASGLLQDLVAAHLVLRPQPRVLERAQGIDRVRVTSVPRVQDPRLWTKYQVCRHEVPTASTCGHGELHDVGKWLCSMGLNGTFDSD